MLWTNNEFNLPYIAILLPAESWEALSAMQRECVPLFHSNQIMWTKHGLTKDTLNVSFRQKPESQNILN